MELTHSNFHPRISKLDLPEIHRIVCVQFWEKTLILNGECDTPLCIQMSMNSQEAIHVQKYPAESEDVLF